MTGTLQLPPESESPWGAVLFLHGSGPQDRNENNPRAPLNIFNTLAMDFVAAGLASLRYDKRGIGESSGDALAASITDFAADAREAVRFLRRMHETQGLPVFVLGHSEGATIALMLAGQDAGIAGAILLCPTVTPMEEILRRQAVGVQVAIDRLPPGQRQTMGIPEGFDQRQATEQMIAAIRSAPAGQASITFMNQPVPAGWFRSHFDLDHGAILERVRCPVLAVGGAKDAQVPPGDAEAIVAMLRHGAGGAARGGGEAAGGGTGIGATPVGGAGAGRGGTDGTAVAARRGAGAGGGAHGAEAGRAGAPQGEGTGATPARGAKPESGATPQGGGAEGGGTGAKPEAGRVGARDFTGVTIPDLTHVLRRSTGDGGVQEYGEMVQRPVDPGLRALLVEWIQRHRPDGEEEAGA